jgi:hypothetical protein
MKPFLADFYLSSLSAAVALNGVELDLLPIFCLRMI